MRVDKFSTVAICTVAILFLVLATLPSPVGTQGGKHVISLSSPLPFIQHAEPPVFYKSLKPRIKKQLRRLVQLQHLI
ncbi:hypothetical protein AB6825_11625 [Serratia proteamaculans]|jgi:hypothetical protein|uniref:hypothetical protein n=1 Tax=Serratia proteamaculans TaxID=28151 RepID=UPI00217BC86B|nr:hypothetical protein [Serratia proteamaculans]CAI1507800.1 Uncharacterised protein [Serratia proteamaculans]CAI1835374.1 Uncharacterised protein [Serratia proteamaculans]CAI2520533.1 Uncharacterised protein [Serratia proteamaculans]